MAFLQEMGPGRVATRSHRFFGRRAGKDSAIGVPKCMTTQITRIREESRWTLLQVGPLLLLSLHAEVARNQRSLAALRVTMQEISQTMHAWKSGRKPWVQAVMGIDANVQLPSDVEGHTSD